jgi:hypothetical protein
VRGAKLGSWAVAAQTDVFCEAMLAAKAKT